MALNHERGSTLLVAQIDQYSENDPSRVWASIPLDEEDLAKGFRNVSYRDLVNAINLTASWLRDHLPPATGPFETIAYIGPKDVRYPIVAAAAAKIERKLLLPSPFATIEAQVHLADVSSCKVFLHAKPSADTAERIISRTREKTASLCVPELAELLFTDESHSFPFTKSWDEAKSDPWLIFHTSGTTGLPKLVTYTHQMMASLDAAELMPDANGPTMNRHFANRRWYTPLPSLHFVGMSVALQFTVFLGSIVVVGPTSSSPTNASVAIDVLKYGQVEGALFPPALIDSVCDDPVGAERLRKLDYLYFAGAPLSRRTAEKLLGHVPLYPGMGSTEAGAYFLKITGDEDWEYYSFRPAMGMELQPVSNDLFEAVFVRDPNLGRWQQIFKIYPHLNEYHTQDLFTKHPSKPGFWKYVGRTDDMIPFSHGENLYVADIEAEITTGNLAISAVQIGGQGRPKPFILVEWKDNEVDDKAKLDQLLPLLEYANRKCSDLVKLSPELVLFTTPNKRLVRTAKGSIARRESEQLYAEEIELLYKQR